MGHVDDCRVEILVEPLDLGAHLHAQLGIEVGQRLVHQEDGRIAHQRAAQCDALLLAARQFARQALEQVGHVEHLRRLAHLLVDLRRRQPAHLQREGEVLVDRLVGIERVVLEHHGDVAILGIEIVDHAVADDDVAAGDRNQPGDQIERRRLAAARWPDQGDELAVVDGQRHVVDGMNGAVGLDEIFEDHVGHRQLP